jgi:hypothetical protein
MSTSATYTQLRDGSWGIRVPGTTKIGAILYVVKKDGSFKTETVDKILWAGRDSKSGSTVSLCAIKRSNGGSTGRGRGKYGCSSDQCYCPQCARGSECQCICTTCGRI